MYVDMAKSMGVPVHASVFKNCFSFLLFFIVQIVNLRSHELWSKFPVTVTNFGAS